MFITECYYMQQLPYLGNNNQNSSISRFHQVVEYQNMHISYILLHQSTMAFAVNASTNRYMSFLECRVIVHIMNGTCRHASGIGRVCIIFRCDFHRTERSRTYLYIIKSIARCYLLQTEIAYVCVLHTSEFL